MGSTIYHTNTAGTDLTGYPHFTEQALTIWIPYSEMSSILFVYQNLSLSGIIPDQDSSGFGTLWVSITGIQNGAPDGLALIDSNSICNF